MENGVGEYICLTCKKITKSCGDKVLDFFKKCTDCGGTFKQEIGENS